MPGSNGTGIAIARPTISVGGQDNAALSDGLLGLMIVENTTGLYRCEALFGNWGTVDQQIDFLYFDRSTLDFGKPFQIKIGTDTIFDGRIMALEGQFPEDQAPAINVLAEDRFQDLRMTRRTRTFSDMSDSDVISQIAGDHGLTANADVSGGTHKVLAQVNQSDLAFLRERARAIDAELWMDGSTLNVQSHANRGGQTLRMDYQNELHEFSALADLSGQRTTVTVSGWDVSSKAAIRYDATDSVIQGELNGDTSGVSILQSALGARKEALVHTVPITSQDAQAEAEAYFKMSARRFVVGRGVAEINNQLRVGSFVNLQGLGPLFSGKYYVTEVQHLFDGARGIRTEFTAERPGLGQP
jgi:uncharacterized protein